VFSVCLNEIQKFLHMREQIRGEHVMKSEMNRTKLAVSATALTVSALVLTVALLVPMGILANDDGELETFTVDVTQDATTNAQNNVDPAKPPDSLSRGDTFIVDGGIYRAHTLRDGIDDPSPNEHPIGSYRIRGTTLLKDADEYLRAFAGDPNVPEAMFFATEEFSFGDGNTILTEGIWPNSRKSAVRAVIGGTGRFRGVVGEDFIRNIGEGSNKFCNARVTFKIRKAWSGHDR
jgi:hypothetical protein